MRAVKNFHKMILLIILQKIIRTEIVYNNKIKINHQNKEIKKVLRNQINLRMDQMIVITFDSFI